MMKEIKDITIILVSYHSQKKLKKIIKNIPREIKIIIVDNSKDYLLKKVFKNKKNIKIYYNNNVGYGASINQACKKTKTKYFCVVQPDVTGLNLKALSLFIKYAKKINNNFAAIGPHFKNATYKGHYQTDLKYDFKKIHNIHGSVMFFYKKNFLLLKGFDENFFLYWEETDLTKRAWKMKLPVYQLNKVKVKHDKGEAVNFLNKKEKNKIDNLYTWHFIWSKFYYLKKHYSYLLALIYFLPTIVRIFFRISLYKKRNEEKYKKYKLRLDGLKSSLLGKKSYLRIKDL